MIENEKLRMSVKPEGYVSELIMKDDPCKMNWVIEDDYLKQAKYDDQDKLFGLFDITANGKKDGSETVKPIVEESDGKITVHYEFKDFQVDITYDLGKDDNAFFWTLKLKNRTEKKLDITEFGVWISILGLLVAAVGQISLGMVGNHFVAIIIAWIVTSMGTGVAVSMPFAMLSDTVDYGEYKNGVRASGFLTAVGSAVGLQVGTGLGDFTPLKLMQHFGYVQIRNRQRAPWQQ